VPEGGVDAEEPDWDELLDDWLLELWLLEDWLLEDWLWLLDD
jgi:hypothetical protein